MSKNNRSWNRKAHAEKHEVTLEELNKKRFDFIYANSVNDFVRCYLNDGCVYCGYVKSFNTEELTLSLYYPYIERSPYEVKQLTLSDECSVDLRKIFRITTHKRVDRSGDKKAPEKLSCGILDSLFSSGSIPDAAPESAEKKPMKAFDDSERRRRARSNHKHRELDNSFEFMNDEKDKEGLEEANFHMGSYDQFAANNEKFGVESEFDITMYSTHVDSNEIPEELVRAAANMEKDFRNSATSNVHIMEERGEEVAAGEEELFSAVNERTKERKRPVKEEKVLSRAIMRPVPASPSASPDTPKLQPKLQPMQTHKKEEKKESKLNAMAPEFVLKPKNPSTPVVSPAPQGFQPQYPVMMMFPRPVMNQQGRVNYPVMMPVYNTMQAPGRQGAYPAFMMPQMMNMQYPQQQPQQQQPQQQQPQQQQPQQ